MDSACLVSFATAFHERNLAGLLLNRTMAVLAFGKA